MNDKSKNRKATIYDIAKKLNVSIATVSRVLSNSGYPVKEETRRRILNEAEEIGYTPNMIGRMLKKNESRDIGVIIPSISNPFYPQMIMGVEMEARSRGYNILLCSSLRDPKIERDYIQTLHQKQVRGLIISSISENCTYLRQLQEYGVKIVSFDQNSEGLECSSVGFDYLKGGLIATEYLIKMGHRNIAFLSAPLTRKSRKEVMEGYRLALLKNGISFDTSNVLISETEEEYSNSNYEFENGRELTRKFLKLPQRPTAIFAVNDMTAFGSIHELMNNNIKIPEDISVIGFDNIAFASMINPQLTTVNQPAFETGRLACKVLVDSMGGDTYSNMSIVLEPTLVIRNSTGSPRI